MFNWTITFLVIALISALFGFGGIASAAASVAKLLSIAFLLLFVISLVMAVRGRRGVA